MNFDQARFNMVEQQIRPWDVLDPHILELFSEIPRHHFVAPEQQTLAYSDFELPIGKGQTMLPPRVEARILQGLTPCADDKALEIGTGSGFTTALLAASTESVTTVEIHPELQDTAKTRLQDFDNIVFAQGDAHQGWEDGQHYDVIFVTGAVPKMVDAFKQQLTLGGRLAITTGEAPAMTTQILTRVSDQEWASEPLFETVLPYLVNAEPGETFQF
ncbi:MAG: protein-L-isoaspartate O-methyltransferase [Hydrogenovibrio sp.]|uniref:protein-L-isoaspartate O-methyltransferase family protein n=1 Tax=Hydrogenovibrio sp. TaxID=2065821 RepID=UPI002870798D|nr:protein-L-isoaspartate O-methyltransferase [Hydrogenovibrio sp.]MDR9499118.1 protein-L-isoaspartate O-methyltransferase [Hydrogenovibrio sp.]